MLDPTFFVVKFLDDLLIGLISCKKVSKSVLLCYFSVAELIQKLLPADIHNILQVLVDCSKLPSMRRPHFFDYDFGPGALLFSDFGFADLEG